MSLIPSKAVFLETTHQYFFGKEELSGITSLIHAALGLGYGDDTPQIAKDLYIPRAAEYGHSVHSAIEQYDKLGIRVTMYPKTPRFRKAPDDGLWDVSQELEGYIANRNGYKPVANEYLVSDEKRYASCVDNVWADAFTGQIWLVDTKTNNLDYYPGKEAGLREYLSWQLSCYAVMFERQNPGVKVAGLAANYLRGDRHELWQIDRKPDEDVLLLLSTEWTVGEDGRKAYAEEPGLTLRNKYYAVGEAQSQGLVSAKAIKTIASLLERKEQIEAEIAELKERLRQKMKEAGAKSIENDKFKATLSADTTATGFDMDAFAEAEPELHKALAAKYKKTTKRKGSLTIKLK